MAVVAQTEEGKLFDWHKHLFMAMGYSEEAAEDMANWGLDWRYVADLIHRGCPLELARRIAE